MLAALVLFDLGIKMSGGVSYLMLELFDGLSGDKLNILSIL